LTPVLLDTGVIVALLHQRDARHEDCAEAIAELHRPFITCEAVITESCYLLQRSPRAVLAVMSNIDNGLFRLPLRMAESAVAIRALMHKYRNVPASLADACLIQMADEFDAGDILTLDSDFLTYRWRRNRPFHMLIPAK
jgi:predicted nucleic acid-binding protein